MDADPAPGHAGAHRSRTSHASPPAPPPAAGGVRPAVSAFVAASAGSGKTKLLTDRLLRLMLAGADPARIQCLTFTKAAAAEMALRLQRRLGEWVTLDDDKLARELKLAWPHARCAVRGAGAVRPRARPARRHADRHHPRLLPVAAAPLPDRGHDLPALQAGRGHRRPAGHGPGPRGRAGPHAAGRAAGPRRPGQRRALRRPGRHARRPARPAGQGPGPGRPPRWTPPCAAWPGQGPPPTKRSWPPP